jgi:murein L,D-transpeptidase YcbB/YkuD
MRVAKHEPEGAKTMPKMVSKGDSGHAVLEVQQKLNALGYNLDEDGIFGRDTRAAVRHFQNVVGLDTDGIVGPDTHSALDAYVDDEWVVEEWVVEEWYVEGEDDEEDEEDHDESDDESDDDE